MADVIGILNTIRSNASADYALTVPTATTTNLTTIGTCILASPNNTNEFVDSLVNRIGMTVVKAKTFVNPLSVLKKGGVPLGDKVQEIYNNPATSVTYDASSTDLLSVVKPDTKVAYYRVNRQAKFRLTITPDMLTRAFVSMMDFDLFVQNVINTLYNGDEIEQFDLTKELINVAHTTGSLTELNLYNENTDNLTDEQLGKLLVKNIQTYSTQFTLPSTAYNKYSTKKGSGTPVKTWTPKEDQVLILPGAVQSNINVEVLSYAFNVAYQQFNQQTLTVDSFNDAPILALLCDKTCFQIYDNLLRLKSFDNGDTLAINYWLHHHQTYGFSLLSNAIAFTYTPKTTT